MKRTLILSTTFTVLCACSRLFSPYHVDIQQGNMIEPSMVNAIKPGMSKAQVEYILGKPLISDMMHPNRWDYVYAVNPQHRVHEQRQLTLFFENDKLVQIRGGFVPEGSQKF